jgi:hypothetical protein
MRFVDSLAKKHSISTDFFSEVWVSEKDRIEYATKKNTIGGAGGHNSAMINIIQESVNCTSRVATFCPFPHLRTHLSDPRKMEDGKYTAEILCDSLKYLEKIDIDTYRSFLEKAYPGFTSEYLIALMDRIYGSKMTIDDIFAEPFYQKYSRTYHEWAQLPESIRRHIRDRSSTIIEPADALLKTDFTSIYSKNHAFFVSLKSDVYTKHTNPNLSPNSFRPYHIIELIFVDIYTISRALKTFKGGLPSQLSVIYLGGLHITHIKELMEPYYRSAYTYGTDFDFMNPTHMQMARSRKMPKCILKNGQEAQLVPTRRIVGRKTPKRNSRKPPKRGDRSGNKRKPSPKRNSRKPSPKRNSRKPSPKRGDRSGTRRNPSPKRR